MVLVWRITNDSPNLPTFPPAKVSLYMVAMGLQPSSDLQYIEQQYICLKPLSVVGLFVISG